MPYGTVPRSRLPKTDQLVQFGRPTGITTLYSKGYDHIKHYSMISVCYVEALMVVTNQLID
jgi:hypothetical protein